MCRRSCAPWCRSWNRAWTRWRASETRTGTRRPTRARLTRSSTAISRGSRASTSRPGRASRWTESRSRPAWISRPQRLTSAACRRTPRLRAVESTFRDNEKEERIMINFVKSGDNLTLAAPYDVLSGGGFKVGNVFGVAATDALSGTNVECEVEGVYDLAKDASTFAQGDLAYWDDTAKKVTSTVGSNLLIGAVEVAAATGAVVVRVNLFGVPGFSGQAHGLKVAYAKYDFG